MGLSKSENYNKAVELLLELNRTNNLSNDSFEKTEFNESFYFAKGYLHALNIHNLVTNEQFNELRYMIRKSGVI